MIRCSQFNKKGDLCTPNNVLKKSRVFFSHGNVIENVTNIKLLSSENQTHHREFDKKLFFTSSIVSEFFYRQRRGTNYSSTDRR